MRSIDQMPLASLLKAFLTTLSRTQVPPESAEYKGWQQRFLIARLRLATQLTFAFYWVVTLLSVIYVYFHPQEASSLILAAVVQLGLGACLALQLTPLGRSHPGLMFLGLCWSMTLFPQLAASLKGSANPNVGLWTLVFLTLAAVIPVRWPLHVTAQLGVLVCYFGLNAVFSSSTQLQPTQLAVVSLYQFWVCFVCDLAVYLYEQLQRAEFESRRELQIFVQAVSQDLRAPVLDSLSVFKPLQPPQSEVSLARTTLVSILVSSERQLQLIHSLLERARMTAGKSGSLVKPVPFANRLWQAAPVQALLGWLRRGWDSLRSANCGVATASAVTDYELWRQRFLLDRLQLVWWITLGGLLTMFVPDLYDSLLNPARQSELWGYAALTPCLLLWFAVYRTPLGQAQPSGLFLSFALVLTLVPQASAALVGRADPDILIWVLIFLMLATLIPVHWPLHIAAQLSAVVSYLGLNAVLDLNPKLSLSSQIGLALFTLWVCFICDLSVYMHERLQRAEFESRRRLRVFLHAVAHDLRTPVLGSIMVLQRLLNQPGEAIKVPRSLPERMVQSGQRQLSLISSLLAVHQSEVQGMVCACEPLQLGPFIRSAVADLEPLLLKNQASLTNRVPDDLPLVSADPNQLWRVFENLLTNALKYNLPGLSLTLQATVEPPMVRCVVQDNGVGISPKLSKQLFDLYTRGSQSRRSPGLGLGLYLCRQIISAHGGQIGVESRSGAGATFWFTLPLAAGQPASSVS